MTGKTIFVLVSVSDGQVDTIRIFGTLFDASNLVHEIIDDYGGSKEWTESVTVGDYCYRHKESDREIVVVEMNVTFEFENKF